MPGLTHEFFDRIRHQLLLAQLTPGPQCLQQPHSNTSTRPTMEACHDCYVSKTLTLSQLSTTLSVPLDVVVVAPRLHIDVPVQTFSTSSSFGNFPRLPWPDTCNSPQNPPQKKPVLDLQQVMQLVSHATIASVDSRRTCSNQRPLAEAIASTRNTRWNDRNHSQQMQASKRFTINPWHGCHIEEKDRVTHNSTS